MSKEEEDKKRQKTIDKAIETMNKGIYEYLDSDRFKTLLDTMSKFHDYSMNNTLLILGQNPRATHLAGYNKWQQDFNRQVKRGEKGLMIWMPVEIKVKEKQYVLDENNINIQEYMLYGDVETKSEKCLVDEGDEVVLTEFPVPEFKNCTLMKKGDEGFYEYKDYRQGENAELAGGYAVSGILQQNKRFDFNYVNDQINGIVQDPFYKVETMGDYQIPMRVLDAYNDLYVATLATTEYIYYLHDSDDALMVGLENRQTIARGEFAMDSYQESFENIYYGNSYEEEIWMDEYEKDAKTQELESNEMEL